MFIFKYGSEFNLDCQILDMVCDCRETPDEILIAFLSDKITYGKERWYGDAIRYVCYIC